MGTTCAVGRTDVRGGDELRPSTIAHRGQSSRHWCRDLIAEPHAVRFAFGSCRSLGSRNSARSRDPSSVLRTDPAETVRQYELHEVNEHTTAQLRNARSLQPEK